MHLLWLRKRIIFFDKTVAGTGYLSNFAPGEMAEWSNAAVLKTVDLHGSGGSNPSLSAKSGVKEVRNGFLFCFIFSYYFIFVLL